MGNLVVFLNTTLDGVVQGPGRPDEDSRDGFRRSGWAAPYASPELGRMVGESMGRASALVFGRRTYEDFHAFWPHQTDNPFTDVLNATTKYVASRTLTQPLPWQNSVSLRGDVRDAVRTLKADEPGELVVLGSVALVRSLGDVVDEYILLLHPLTLGSGTRLFQPGDPERRLRLLEFERLSTGVAITRYTNEGG